MSEDSEFVLQRLLDNEKPLRSLALEALSDFPRRKLALFSAIWAQMNGERRFELVQALIERAETNVRLNFATILRNCLGDGDARVRKLAIDGLWEDTRPILVGLLSRLLASDPSTEVRAAAAISLGRFVLLGEVGEISDALAAQADAGLRATWFRPGESTEVRRRALEGMAYTGAPEVLELIRNAYYDEDELMRQSAVYAMGRSADRRWTSSVLVELNSQSAAMRFEAATAAGELALALAIKPLVGLLDDVDSNVREAAALALGQIGGPEARRALEACATGDDERLAQAAEEALQELAFNSDSAEQPLFDIANAAAPDPLVDDDISQDDAWDGEGDEEDADDWNRTLGEKR